jgi:hypothetical protein
MMLKGLVKIPSPAKVTEFIALDNGVLTEKIIMVQWASSYGYKRATSTVLKLTINQSTPR